ncbi:hypothetical protein B0H14DRAFT_2573734 [Mycena olivaceomarginata]|nr:hypothetical protein B0H14DRAFT_2573734 [Mycena olivaceomarginata]
MPRPVTEPGRFQVAGSNARALNAPRNLTDPAVGNPWRESAKGSRVCSFPIWMYCDDTSGNVSKKWNKHNSFLFTPAGLPHLEWPKQTGSGTRTVCSMNLFWSSRWFLRLLGDNPPRLREKSNFHLIFYALVSWKVSLNPPAGFHPPYGWSQLVCFLELSWRSHLETS